MYYLGHLTNGEVRADAEKQYTPRTRMPRLRKPDAADGATIWELVKACKRLDENSMYCNLIPAKEELFIKQVAVGPRARGLGLGKKMLLELIQRDACDGAARLKTTITKSNKAS